MPQQKRLYIYFLVIIFLVTACSQIVIEPNRYYILEYKGLKGDETLQAHPKVSFGLNVSEAEVSGTYNRKQIVLKTSENQIRYDLKNLWAERLPSSVASIVHQRISQYNIFTRVSRDYQQQTRYDVTINVKALELINYSTINGARIDLEIILKRTSDNLTVFIHNADRFRRIPVYDTEMFVQTIHDLIIEETDKFLKSLLSNIGKIETNTDVTNQVYTSRDFFEPRADSLFTLEPIEDDYVSLLGKLYIPFMTDPEHEPPFAIEDMEGNFIESFPMGSEVHLEEGKYIIRLGNGTTNQKVVETVEIFSRYKTTLEPQVGGLIVNIIDNGRNYIDRRYELFDLDTAESYGFGYGIEDGVGQQLETWILKPNHYKIVLNDKDFNSYEDFTTVEVKTGEVERLTIVVNAEEPYNLLGAGRLIQEDIVKGKDRTYFSIMNHLNGNFNSRNDAEKNKNNYTLTITEQLDTKLTLDYFPVNFTLKNWIEVGVSKDKDTDLNMQSDKFDLKNTLIYYFFTSLGVYGRADVNTHLFNYFEQTDEKVNYIRIDKKGNETNEYTNKFQTQEPFTPLTLKEGIGLNYRALNYNRANLNIRAGVGMRQDYYTNAYYLKGARTVNGTTYQVYEAIDDVFDKGTEFSANGNFQIFRNLNYTLTADVLLPFDSNKATYEMENILNLRLFKYVSWDYRLNLKYNENERDYTQIEHTLFLRFTYIFVN